MLTEEQVMEKIQKVKDRKKAEKEKKDREYKELLLKIEVLAPRIEKILKFANMLVENDIERDLFFKEHIVANGSSHKVGLMRTKDNKFEYIEELSNIK